MFFFLDLIEYGMRLWTGSSKRRHEELIFLLFILFRLNSAPNVKMSKPVGKNDMTALREISDAAIAENLKERLKAGIIYVSV